MADSLRMGEMYPEAMEGVDDALALLLGAVPEDENKVSSIDWLVGWRWRSISVREGEWFKGRGGARNREEAEEEERKYVDKGI